MESLILGIVALAWVVLVFLSLGRSLGRIEEQLDRLLANRETEKAITEKLKTSRIALERAIERGKENVSDR